MVLWVLADDRRLGAGARQRMEAATPRHVSAATVWELTIKAMLGRLTIPEDLPAALDQQGFTHLPVTADDAWTLRAFPELSRHDPFDRLLLAQSRRLDLPFLTADRALLASAYAGLVDARS